jgi:hypothetical protein
MNTKFYPINWDDNKMINFITEVIDLLEGSVPGSEAKCSICKVRNLVKYKDKLQYE